MNKSNKSMTAEEIIEYIDSKLKGNVVPFDAERDAIQMIHEYARLQIEKDRERVKAQIYYDDGATTIADSFNIVPITLD